MKKKLIIGIAILSMAISFVGCSSATLNTVNNESTEPYVDVTRSIKIGNDEQLEQYLKYNEYLAEIQRNPDSDIEIVEEVVAPTSDFDRLTVAWTGESVPDDVMFKIDAISEITIEMYEVYADDILVNYVEPYLIECTGELKDGKTYIYYNGYVTTKDGQIEDYYKEFVLDFTLEPEIFNFTLDD